MRTMVERFRDHVRDQTLAPLVLEKIDAFLTDPVFDIEHLIEDLDHLTNGTATADKWGLSSGPSIDGIRVVRPEAEWFVQHVCERIDPRRAEYMWESALMSGPLHHLTIATTNYDRAIELAAGRISLAVRDGFEEFGQKEWAPWSGSFDSASCTLIKLHGSTDWYQAVDGTVVKLRHAMAAYGDVTIHLGGPDPRSVRNASILPSREKKVREPPYPDLTHQFRKAIDDADLIVFLGTSLRDPDLRSMFAAAAARVPTFIVSRSGIFADPLPPSAQVIRQTASRFLISTLPGAIASDPIPYLSNIAARSHPDSVEVLSDLAVALDRTRSANARCAAIDELANHGIDLSRRYVERLLNDPLEDIQMYALGLIPFSRERAQLLESAKTVAAAVPGTPFASEVSLLLEMSV